MVNTETPALVIRNLTKNYGRSRGIDAISLEVKTGEVFGFLGPNGAGKSTTINTILDILRPDEGTVDVLGVSHRHVTKVHESIGYLAGDMTLDPALTGKQYLSFVAHSHQNVDQSYLEELVARLKAETTTTIKHLSRGNKQKIGLIAALMHKPDVLILDEPTSGLDPLIQLEFNRIIQEHKAAGKTAFISSHILSEVQEICDRVAFIREGKLITVSPLSELLRQASQTVSVDFRKTPPKEALANLKGVSELTISGLSASFNFNGDTNQLISLLVKHSVTTLEISEANLEALFMKYYTEEKHNV